MLTAIPRHPLPFAAKNMFYDERWIEKQERGFTWWMNYVLTPDDFKVATEVTKGVVSVWKSDPSALYFTFWLTQKTFLKNSFCRNIANLVFFNKIFDCPNTSPCNSHAFFFAQ